MKKWLWKGLGLVLQIVVPHLVERLIIAFFAL